jgi:hypothetical protein
MGYKDREIWKVGEVGKEDACFRSSYTGRVKSPSYPLGSHKQELLLKVLTAVTIQSSKLLLPSLPSLTSLGFPKTKCILAESQVKGKKAMQKLTLLASSPGSPISKHEARDR